jgi:segregation and condensation protein B
MELELILEAILFQAQKPMTPAELQQVLVTTAERAESPDIKVLKKTKLDHLQKCLEEISLRSQNDQRSFHLICVAGSWQFVTLPEYAPWLRVLLGEKPHPPRLSQPGLETLAIVAYRQPITRAEIEQIRGVSVDGVVATLLERGLIEVVGRAEVIGRPMTYGTTTHFLEYFGLRGLEDLPASDELRRITVVKAAELLTADPGLATAPPDALISSDSQQSETKPEAAAPEAVSSASSIPPIPPVENNPPPAQAP